jgi:hypothetical protein
LVPADHDGIKVEHDSCRQAKLQEVVPVTNGRREWSKNISKIMEQHAFKNVNNCLNTNIYPFLETSGGQNSNPYLKDVHFFQHQSSKEICGSLRQLFSYIGD